MPDDSIPESVTDCFLSYKREDNDLGGVVDRIRTDLNGMYSAHTGKSLRVFIDRESIGWGEDWRQKIRESVERATVFVPVVTMRYFTSQHCREELMSFYNNADQLGVTELLLPIVLMGEDQIRSDDSREEVRLIETLNYKRLQKAWLAGFDSPEWRQAMFDCVQDLDSALQAAERTLAQRETGSSALLAQRERSLRTGDETESDVSDVPEGIGDMVDLTERFLALEPLATAAVQALTTFSNETEEAFGGIDVETLSTDQTRVKLFGAAAKLKGSSNAVFEHGERLQTAVEELDALLRGFVEEMRGIHLPQVQGQIDEMLLRFRDETGELAEAVEVVGQMVEMLKFVSLMNVALRKALRPGIRGLQSIKSAVSALQTWERLSSSGETA